MFEDAIESVGNYTRALHLIRRRFGDNAILPDCGTLFFVNDDGCAIMSGRMASHIPAAEQMEKKYRKFTEERESLTRDASMRFEQKRLERKYNYGADVISQLRFSFVDCIAGGTGFSLKIHPKYDLALVKFNEPERFFYKGHAVFASKPPRQGQELMRVGFAFPEFRNFDYDRQKDTIEFHKGAGGLSRFPVEGIMTRFVQDSERCFGIEVSTPAPIGMAGAPLFDEKGLVYGMYFGTRCLYSGVGDVKDGTVQVETVERNEQSHEIIYHVTDSKVSDSSFTRVGQCVHMDLIKEFLNENDVRFYEA
ncbi:MAG TPA: hypothetical protein P5116_04070 [Eubacteriales bacterium]|nr:hypothetical protein [Eubacteriales bacterium]